MSRCVTTLLILSSTVGVLAGDERSSELPGRTTHFVFHSDFATNLNDALIVAGTARARGNPGTLASGAAERCLSELSPSARLGLELAVDYFAEVVSPADWTDRQQYLLRVELAGSPGEIDERGREFTGIAAGFRAAAAPAYETCAWPDQDARNRRWAAALVRRLVKHEEPIARRLAELYATPWKDLPMRVDIVAHAPPLGANSLVSPQHVLISTAIEERDALEVMLHEASHTLMGRDAPVRRALVEAAARLDVELPDDLWHVVLFFTTGHVVREVLEQAGEPAYLPYIDAHDLWDGRWGRYRRAIEQSWPRYLEGETDLAAAAVELLRRIDETDQPEEQ